MNVNNCLIGTASRYIVNFNEAALNRQFADYVYVANGRRSSTEDIISVVVCYDNFESLLSFCPLES